MKEKIGMRFFVFKVFLQKSQIERPKITFLPEGNRSDIRFKKEPVKAPNINK